MILLRTHSLLIALMQVPDADWACSSETQGWRAVLRQDRAAPWTAWNSGHTGRTRYVTLQPLFRRPAFTALAASSAAAQCCALSCSSLVFCYLSPALTTPSALPIVAQVAGQPVGPSPEQWFASHLHRVVASREPSSSLAGHPAIGGAVPCEPALGGRIFLEGCAASGSRCAGGEAATAGGAPAREGPAERDLLGEPTLSMREVHEGDAASGGCFVKGGEHASVSRAPAREAPAERDLGIGPHVSGAGHNTGTFEAHGSGERTAAASLPAQHGCAGSSAAGQDEAREWAAPAAPPPQPPTQAQVRPSRSASGRALRHVHAELAPSCSSLQPFQAVRL